MIFTTKRAASALLFFIISCSSASAITMFSSNFKYDPESFTYADDTFRNTTQRNYASGKHVKEIFGANGYLEVKLGGIDTKSIYGMSGGWVREFTLPASADVSINLRYELRMSRYYEKNEFVQALCSVDGRLVGSTTTKDYIGQIYGESNGLIGYNWVKLQLGILKEGKHRLIVGAYNNIKTTINEESRVLFRDVSLEYNPTTITTRTPTRAPVKPPTRAPVKPPTKAPTKAPVKPLTKAPTKAPMKPLTKTPTRAPVKPLTKTPTKAPVKAPTKAPTRAPIKPLTKAPTRAPIKPLTKAPTRAPVKPLTKAPTTAPAKPLTKAPTKAPANPLTKAPTRAPVEPPTNTPTKTPTRVPIKLVTDAPVKAPNMAPISTGLFEARINVGSVDTYVDPDGVTWEADKYFGDKGDMYAIPIKEIAGTDSDALYCKERYYNIWGPPQPYSYNIPVPRQGAYTVRLHFAEIHFANKGERVFDVMVNGKLAVKQLDIVDKAGPNTALIIPVTTKITGSVVTIAFVPSKENPKICAIEVLELTDYVEPPTAAPVAQPFSMLINCGGTAFVETVGGRTWNADQYFIGGNPYTDGRNPIRNSLDYNLYQTERYGEFKYEVPVPVDGTYEVILHFAELYWEENGKRIFNIEIENSSAVFENVDIVALGNGVNQKAVTLESFVSVTDGFVSIQLSFSNPQVDNPKLSGIEIIGRSDL